MNLFTADVGQGKVHIYDSGNDKFFPKLPQQHLIDLNIEGLKRGDIVVVEDAHLREAHKHTMAQPFSFEKLIELKKNAEEKGISIRLFPQQSTPKARRMTGYANAEKNDEVDTKAIAKFLLQNENVLSSLKIFNPKRLTEFQEKNQFIFDYIKICNDDINEAKTLGYGFEKKHDYSDAVSKWIETYKLVLIERLADPELVSAIGLEQKKSGKYEIKNANRIYTLVHSILRPNGEIRLRSDVKKLPHWKFIKSNYLGCKPFHMKQGVPSSNYKHHFRPIASEYKHPNKSLPKGQEGWMHPKCNDFEDEMSPERLRQLAKGRTKVDKMVQKIWYVLRDMIMGTKENEYKDKLR
tara:strand:+ start:218 stop:1270 length:1053 start_codon:yes stop_codon:yes gene_type:complete